MISVVIPAFNEGKNIGRVLSVLETIDMIDEIIVVNDGSTDDTKEQALKHDVKLVDLPKNQGKGKALKAGIDNAKGDIIVMLDADLIGLTEKHFVNLVSPVLKDEADMTIGIFSGGRKSTDFAQKVAPFLSGQRAIKRQFLENIEKMEVSKFGVEIALNKHAKKNKLRVVNVPLENLSHVMKEEKLGLIKGFYARLKMYFDILKMGI
ncbi:glycosyl transferase family 2 [Thermoanaerobacter mathranii subsp. mathranii str. A3]|uniref:Glucosyl-3-phosphoglycerate synthase n=3 Tax=Thermoanaerobacter TaxID=1754 RepID=D3T2K5_THEIA|nr:MULTISPECIES: glycosyltransferase family 2 protein [Thermoanaerobacter]ADD02457.1 glycosyl transferase family 2 [Thermoanaerobacter italicus Ab9]ADH60959.1 glycosyl transferase family 2 [Thermoanaerobacter mathranii subsp. mathranii str. A3]KUJ91505.1 MAG: family 2 glycosyl transferase [Thermoanaerobacter thermocopriae]MDP9749912.1 glycosyltransferase involved in cell wall biosynthesis [Thermoanaerobacter pentosaceus]